MSFLINIPSKGAVCFPEPPFARAAVRPAAGGAHLTWLPQPPSAGRVGPSAATGAARQIVAGLRRRRRAAAAGVGEPSQAPPTATDAGGAAGGR